MSRGPSRHRCTVAAAPRPAVRPPSRVALAWWGGGGAAAAALAGAAPRLRRREPASDSLSDRAASRFMRAALRCAQAAQACGVDAALVSPDSARPSARPRRCPRGASRPRARGDTTRRDATRHGCAGRGGSVRSARPAGSAVSASSRRQHRESVPRRTAALRNQALQAATASTRPAALIAGRVLSETTPYVYREKIMIRFENGARRKVITLLRLNCAPKMRKSFCRTSTPYLGVMSVSISQTSICQNYAFAARFVTNQLRLIEKMDALALNVTL